MLIQLDYGNDFGIKYTYNDEDQVTVKTYTSADGTVTDNWVTYTYTNRGELASVKDNLSGIIVNYQYDALGRLIKYYETGGGRSYHEVSYYYDDFGNLEYRVEKIGGETRVTAYTYDQQNRAFSSCTDDYGSDGYFTRNVSAWYDYDDFDRVTYRRSTNGNDDVLHSYTTYRPSSSQVAQIQNITRDDNFEPIYNATYTYTYDDNGNIRTVNDGSYTTTYTYDGANQLIREDNQRAGTTWTWSYDDAGNLLDADTYAYTLGTLGSSTSNVAYVYGNSQWGDLLTAYDGVAITYDEIGNPLNDGTWTYTWERGRQLKSMSNGSTTWNMTYDADGLRTSRIAGSNKYYYYHDGLLTYMKFNSLVTRFTYDAQGKPVSMTYNGNLYFYALNQQGDVMALLDVDGNEVVSYHYNAWGKILSTTASTETMRLTLAKYNPLRYRGYIYDRETGLYYLQSRYYNPEICRFTNADCVVSNVGENILGNNMFVYCLNNPVNMSDLTGNWPTWGQVFTAIATVAVAVVIAAAVVAAAPAAAGAIAATASYYGVSAAGVSALATATSIGCAGVAAGVLVTGVNRAAESVTGTNYGAELLGDENYAAIESTVNFAAMMITSIPQTTPYPSTGRSEPQNLNEQVAMRLSKANPDKGKVIIPYLNDPRMPGWLGWQKNQISFKNGDTTITIHYVSNKVIPFFFDFKFK